MSLLHDVLFSIRSLRKAPGFTLVVIFTMALGIAANTAVFSILHAALLQPLPYPDYAHLLKLYEAKTPNDYRTHGNVSPANFLDWQEQSRAFTEMAASSGFRYNLSGNGLPEQVWGGAISAGWFNVMGVRPELGRTLRPEEDSPGAAPVVLLSDDLWRRKYNADPAILGKNVGINGEAFTVVGVMAPKSDFRSGMELWIALQKQIRPDRMLWRDSRFLEVIARPRPGVTLPQAAADLNRIQAAIRQAHPTGDIDGAALVLPLREYVNGDMRSMLLVSFATVMLVLLVACANVASLMLLRVTSRIRELAIRMALGARQRDLIRQLVIEGLCLGATAGAAGLMLGQAGKKVLLWLLSWQSPELTSVDLSWPVLLFTFGVSVAAGIFFALVPALAVLRPQKHDLLRRASSGNTTEIHGNRLRQGFVIAEIACCVVLLAGAGLLVRSLQNLRRQPLGFQTDHRVVVTISLPRTRYQRDPDVVRFYEQVADRVRALPGVEDASFTYAVPLNGSQFGTTFTKVATKAEDFHEVDLRLADSHLFAALGVPLLHGRLIMDSDLGNSEPVCLVSLAMARRYYPDQDPIGQLIILQRLDVNGQRRPRRIVGVVGDTRDFINQEPPPLVYVPYSQESFFSMQLLVHTQNSMADVRNSVTAVLTSIDPDEPIRSIQNFDDFLPGALGDWTLAISLLGGLATVAILLTAIGVFAVIGYMVRERTREIGIRMAMGATPRRVRNLVLWQTGWLAGIGAVCGLGMAAVCTRFLGSLIYGVRATDPVTFITACAGLGVAALLAGYIPARRAMRVDPMLALRDE